ncbi:hypothetical protein [Streptomyces sp. NBC_00370]|uniref:hypothetical protein n=1 Tax=Streptomyces sp. NBC_00370 TaxID=2975728 RepID=UPI002E271BDB
MTVSALTAEASVIGVQMMDRLIEAAGLGREPAEDMADLAELIRTLLAVDQRRDTCVRLGGNLFDVVITASGIQAHAAVARMDELQRGCGPVIEDPDSGWLYWLVPPGTSTLWAPHTHGVCVGGPHTITLPPLNRSAPPGPYWLRPSASDRLVPPSRLREALAQLRPEPPPHTALTQQLTSAT